MNYKLRQTFVGLATLTVICLLWFSVVQPDNPLKYAHSKGMQVENKEPTIPLSCYTKTEGQFNACWACHTTQHSKNFLNDVVLQDEYILSDSAKTNFWTNAFLDISNDIKKISNKEIEAYIREDNYKAFQVALTKVKASLLWKPDLQFNTGFDTEGFANDGSGWRALRFKPFLGTFWPLNGNSNDVYIRLPQIFQQDQNGKFNRELYKANLSLLELAMTVPPGASVSTRLIEPINETMIQMDLNQNGVIEKSVNTLQQLPEFFLGKAQTVKINTHLYPRGTEFLHTVRYLDPQKENFAANRMKEVRYSKKINFFETWAMIEIYKHELEEKDKGRFPFFAGDAEQGLYNNLGWLYQGYIENEKGNLRLQSFEEQKSCMGCHANLGVTVDSSFSFIRKVPGAEGWRVQNVLGISDVPQWGHSKPETIEYIERSGALDEFRTNKPTADQMQNSSAMLADWILPTPEKALQMNKAYKILVERQNFERGRNIFLEVPQNILKTIEAEKTGLKENQKMFFDGVLWLDWGRITSHSRAP